MNFKISTLILLFLLFRMVGSQSIELKDPNLIQYYQHIHQAEMAIVDNDLEKAHEHYEKAFGFFDEPHAKDLYNDMMVLIHSKKTDLAHEKYQRLNCMDYRFDKDFHNKHFGNQYNSRKTNCNFKIDLEYRMKLDSLHFLDQYYRLLSDGDYDKFAENIEKYDSIVSNELYKLFIKKGFPNEYNIGLSRSSTDFFNGFYIIIVHQLARNSLFPQQVDFSNEINNALNQGKLSPEFAGHLSDLVKGTENFNPIHFDIKEFAFEEEDFECCYVHEWFVPEKRGEKGNQFVEQINENRSKIGMSSIDDLLKKRLYNLRNTDYVFPYSGVVGSQSNDKKYIEFMKKHLIKINETNHQCLE
ncbi:MAG: hypothetical protein Q4G27_05420 [Flavobacteriaceae bacterium]|nr:hypothetical protein [Flavobacteriaceae bacterium]